MKLSNFLLIMLNTIFIRYNVYSHSSKLSSRSSKANLSLDKTKTISLIIESRPNKSSLVNLKTKASTLGFSFGMSNKNFLITAFNKPTMTINNNGENKVFFGGRSMSISSLNLNNNFKYRSQRQWRMVLQDSFNLNNTIYNGWDYGIITKCGSYYNIFGGYCQLSSKEINKEVNDLPPHKQIKIEVNYHFIGNWQGETGYLKLNSRTYKKESKYLWTYRCNHKNVKKTIVSKTCGYDVCLLNYPVSITIQHTEPKVSISFGAFLSNNLPCDRSYGISNFRLFIQ